MIFNSEYAERGPVRLPNFSGIRVMMMPVVIGDIGTVPIDGYEDAVADLFGYAPEHAGKVGYVTIDEKVVEAGETHRRRGLHVDGVFRGQCGSWGGGGWASVSTGMVLVSKPAGCRVYPGEFDGDIGDDGECDRLDISSARPVLLRPSVAYWASGLCVHESIEQPEAAPRQLVRLSLPSTAPWFEGYTENPLGVMPTGPILPRRQYMEA
jgi:hypothetical protein